MRVLIAAGGTGGHIYPGIAVANELRRRDGTTEIRFVGTAKGLENQLVPKAGYQLSLIESAGLVNMGIAGRMRGLGVLPKSFLGARRLLKSFQPDVVVGAGGYVSGPVLLTAAAMRLPTMIMESNAVPGFTNRRLARWVRRAAASFESALPYFRGKGIVTGNPVRHEFFDISSRRRESRDRSILVFGGSQGARAINNAMVGALSELESLKPDIQIVHQTGDMDFERISSAYKDSGWTENVSVRRYIDNMVDEFEKADLVVSRAGATTSAELMAAGKAAIMVPLPGQMEQQRNAEEMQRLGAARMILQDALTPQSLAKTILEIVSSDEILPNMEDASKKGSRKDAAEKAADLIEDLADGG